MPWFFVFRKRFSIQAWMTWIEDVMICRKTGQFYEQKCATKTVVKLSSKLSSNEKLKPCDAVIARASAIYFAGAPDWSAVSLKRSEIKGFSDFQNLAKSRNDALKHWNDSGTMHGFVVRISHD